MSRYVRRRSHKLGKSPGTVSFAGERKVQDHRLTVIRYGSDNLEEGPLSDADIETLETPSTGVLWLNVDGVHNEEILQRIATRFGIHPLAIEDVASTLSRAKIEPYDGSLFMVMRMLTYDPVKRLSASEQISLFIAPGLVISFQERPGDVFDAVRNRIRNGSPRIRNSGSDYLAYALLDVTIDHYFITLEALGDEIEGLEELVLSSPSIETQRRVRNLRSNLAMIRRSVWPLREVLAFLSRDEDPVITSGTRLFVRDAYDHTIQAMDIVESLRDLVGGLQDLTLSAMSNRMNEVMKVLTIIGTIFIPLTFIAGIYGMNFENMPELHARYGYPIAIAAMAVIAGLLLMFFRRKKWL